MNSSSHARIGILHCVSGFKVIMLTLISTKYAERRREDLRMTLFMLANGLVPVSPRSSSVPMSSHAQCVLVQGESGR